jgi:hypothetical protein
MGSSIPLQSMLLGPGQTKGAPAYKAELVRRLRGLRKTRYEFLGDADFSMVETFVEENSEAFFVDGARPSRLRGFRFDILLSDDEPVTSKAFGAAPDRRAEVSHHVEKQLELGNIVRGSSQYSSSGFTVKEAGKPHGRFVIDYRKLNRKTLRSHEPIPDIWDMLRTLADGERLTALDLNQGFHQLGLTERAQDKLAFVVPDGQFQWNTLPMGPCNGPPSFQAAMRAILSRAAARRGVAAIFIDDLAIRT